MEILIESLKEMWKNIIRMTPRILIAFNFRVNGSEIISFLVNIMCLFTWIIHESRLLQMQGTGHEDVVFHFECPITKQMQQDRLASMVKKWRLK